MSYCGVEVCILKSLVFYLKIIVDNNEVNYVDGGSIDKVGRCDDEKIDICFRYLLLDRP